MQLLAVIPICNEWQNTGIKGSTSVKGSIR